MLGLSLNTAHSQLDFLQALQLANASSKQFKPNSQLYICSSGNPEKFMLIKDKNAALSASKLFAVATDYIPRLLGESRRVALNFFGTLSHSRLQYEFQQASSWWCCLNDSEKQSELQELRKKIKTWMNGQHTASTASVRSNVLLPTANEAPLPAPDYRYPGFLDAVQEIASAIQDNVSPLPFLTRADLINTSEYFYCSSENQSPFGNQKQYRRKIVHPQTMF
ncbi:hypothetical protein JYU14_01060, partial [Simkania negevensis]|nr:hypothetical protein [Simkania negevensis]